MLRVVVAIPLPFLRKLLPCGYKAESILAEGQQIPYLPPLEEGGLERLVACIRDRVDRMNQIKTI
jgi:hypothetical protein